MKTIKVLDYSDKEGEFEYDYILPCPFCGNEFEDFRNSHIGVIGFDPSIRCTGCYANGPRIQMKEQWIPLNDKRKHALFYWNLRCNKYEEFRKIAVGDKHENN